MFQVLHGTVLGQQAVAGTPYHIDIPVTHEQILRQALHGGAAAARHAVIPSARSKIGKRADIVLVGTTDPGPVPCCRPHDHVG